MRPLTVGEIARAVSGKLLQGDPGVTIDDIGIDSREFEPGALFIALIGDNHDGHNFIPEAVTKGAAALLVDRDVDPESELPVIKAGDTTRALQELAHYYRRLYPELEVIAVTGSAGKTTTKDMLYSLLSRKYKVGKSRGNLNNHIGLPLSVLALSGAEELAVLEMGMSSLGEISRLTGIAEPGTGVITNVGSTHLEFLGSVANVARGKSELIAGLPESGTAVLNFDNGYVREMDAVFSGDRLIYYGLDPGADLVARNLEPEEEERGITFEACYHGQVERITLPRPGKHNVYNALAAMAVAREFGLGWQQIRQGFLDLELSRLRMDIRELADFTLINDTYNANPLAMKAAIDVLIDIADRRRLAVLGEMLELGDRARTAHLEVGDYLAEKSVDIIITFGHWGRLIARGAVRSGVSESSVYHVTSKRQAIDLLQQLIESGDTLLVKGSRGNQMEEIVQALIQEEI